MGVNKTGQTLRERLAAELHAERTYQRMTYAEFAKRSGIGERSLHRYLNATRDISTDDLVKMCKALGVPPEEMFLRAATGQVNRPATGRPSDGMGLLHPAYGG
jgi:transcriptional regulator with XRE-family HTH domain